MKPLKTIAHLKDWWECGINRPNLWLHTSVPKKGICITRQKSTHCTRQSRASSWVLIETYFLAGSQRSSVNGHCHVQTCVFIWLLRQCWDLAICLLHISEELTLLKPLGKCSNADFIFFANTDISKYLSPSCDWTQAPWHPPEMPTWGMNPVVCIFKVYKVLRGCSRYTWELMSL